MAGVAVPKELFQEIIRLIDGLRPGPGLGVGTVQRIMTKGEVCPNAKKIEQITLLGTFLPGHARWPQRKWPRPFPITSEKCYCPLQAGLIRGPRNL
jgi:hypothetical protein